MVYGVNVGVHIPAPWVRIWDIHIYITNVGVFPDINLDRPGVSGYTRTSQPAQRINATRHQGLKMNRSNFELYDLYGYRWLWYATIYGFGFLIDGIDSYDLYIYDYDSCQLLFVCFCYYRTGRGLWVRPEMGINGVCPKPAIGRCKWRETMHFSHNPISF